MKRTHLRRAGAGAMVVLWALAAVSGVAWAERDASPPHPEVTVEQVWPDAGGMLPANGVVEIRYRDGLHEDGLPVNLVVAVEVVAPTPAAVPGRLVANPMHGSKLWWVPEAPYVEGATYRITLREDFSDPPRLLLESTFTVGGDLYPVPGLPGPESWCLDSVQPGTCISFDAHLGCSEWVYGPPEDRARVTLLAPDIDGLGRVGRWFEVKGPGNTRWRPWAGWSHSDDFLAVASDDRPCVGLRMRTIDGASIGSIDRCAPTPMPRCEGVVPPDSGPPGDLDGGARHAGTRDAGTDTDVSERRARGDGGGCQAGPGAGGVPLVAGLFALLLGLGRRRRTG